MPSHLDKRNTTADLALVGAVLKTTQKKRTQKKRTRNAKRPLTVGQRLRRVRFALRNQTRKHPYATVGIAVSVLALAYLICVTNFFLAQRPEIAVDAGVNAGHGSSGSAITDASLPGSTVETPVDDRVDAVVGRRDIARDLSTRIAQDDYVVQSEVATGRFLREFDHQFLQLMGTDWTKLQPAYRGTQWAEVRAPYHYSETLWKHRTHLSSTTSRMINATQALIRLEKRDGTWRIENIRVR